MRRVRTAAGLVGVLLLSSTLVPAAATDPGETSATAETGAAARPYPQLARGDFIFYPMQVHYDPVAKDRYFDYLKRFRVCLTNGYDVFTSDDLAHVQQAGCELFVYRWFAGYYVHEALFGHPAVQPMLQEVDRHPDWLINPHAPTAGNGAVSPAYFFDWANPDLRAFYIEQLVAALGANGYDGVFFDYIGDWGLPPQISALWSVKHPEMTYNQASAVFLRELRAAMGSRPIFGNAAYKADKAENNNAFYESVTYDTTESYGVTYVGGKDAVVYLERKGMTAVKETYYRPWDGPSGYKDWMEGPTFGPVQHQDGVVEFFPIDYVLPAYELTGDHAVVDGSRVPVYRPVADKAAVHYSYALAKLHDMSSFASDWSSWLGDPSSFEPDDVYFVDLGAPLEWRYRELDDVVVRYFENGFVVVTRSNTPVRFAPDRAMAPDDAAGLWDVYADAPVSAAAVDITPVVYPASESAYPSGRVYMYTR